MLLKYTHGNGHARLVARPGDHDIACLHSRATSDTRLANLLSTVMADHRRRPTIDVARRLERGGLIPAGPDRHGRLCHHNSAGDDGLLRGAGHPTVYPPPQPATHSNPCLPHALFDTRLGACPPLPVSTSTRQDHPLLCRPFMQVHPCRTHDLMAAVRGGGRPPDPPEAPTTAAAGANCSYLASWLSFVAPMAGLHVAL